MRRDFSLTAAQGVLGGLLDEHSLTLEDAQSLFESSDLSLGR